MIETGNGATTAPIFDNVSPLLMVQKPGRRGGTDFVNAAVVGGRAFTVGHIPRDSPFTIVDTITGRHASAEYLVVDHRIDAGVLNVRCSGPGYELGEATIDEIVNIHWATLTFRGLAHHNIMGRVVGRETIGDYTETAVFPLSTPDHDDEVMNVFTCGAAVTDQANKQLYGLINKAPDSPGGSAPDLIYMARINDILKIGEGESEILNVHS